MKINLKKIINGKSIVNPEKMHYFENKSIKNS